MANTVQIKRGNTASVSSYTGPSGEIIYNLDTGRLHAQDGSTAGGNPHALISDVDLKANAAINISAGSGLTGGGTLAANRTLALSSASIASLGKADSAVQTVNGVSPVAGNVTVAAEEKRLQDTRTTAIAETFAGSVNFVQTAGYYTPGDGGGALYKRVSSEPTHAGKFQSADGAWWELVIGKNNVRQFGAREVTSFDSRDAFIKYVGYCELKGLTAYFDGSPYYVSSPVEVGNVAVICDADFIAQNALGEPISAFSIEYRWAETRLTGGDALNSAKKSVQVGNWIETFNKREMALEEAIPEGYKVLSWYDGDATNKSAYLPGGVNFESDVNYGLWAAVDGKRASGSHTLYTGRIIVSSAEGEGSTRTELVPLGLGINFTKDADVIQGEVSVYNDIVVGGPIGATVADREAFLAGISMRVQKFSPGNDIDASHDGSYGMTISTRPQINDGWDPDNGTRTESTYALRSMLALVGFSGDPSTVFSGSDSGAGAGADMALQIGGYGGSQWLSPTARSRFAVGINIEDYTEVGIRLRNVAANPLASVHALICEGNAGAVRFDNDQLYIANLPTSSSGLAKGRVWVDAAAGNVLKVVP